MLDRKDLAILRELELDARQSFGSIAKRTKLSKEVVLYRIRAMEKQGIIKGYITEIDLFKAGYALYPVLLRLEEMPRERREELHSYISKSKDLGWAAVCEGSWDLNLVLRTRSASDVAAFFDELESRYGDLIQEKALMHTISLSYLKRGFGAEGARTRVTTEEKAERLKLSAKEERLLHAISGDARKPVSELAKAAGVCAPTALSMLREMEKAKVIQGYRVFTDFSAIGHIYQKLWLSLKGMDRKTWQRFYTKLSFDPHALWATRTIGHYDFSIELEVPSLKESRDLIEELREDFHQNIRRKDSYMVRKELLLSYYPS